MALGLFFSFRCFIVTQKHGTKALVRLYHIKKQVKKFVLKIIVGSVCSKMFYFGMTHHTRDSTVLKILLGFVYPMEHFFTTSFKIWLFITVG